MKKSISTAAIMFVIMLAAWMGKLDSRSKDSSPGTSPSKVFPSEDHEELPATDGFKTKARIREAAKARATHRPDQLKEFILPVVYVEESSLGEALRKLREVYEETCRKTGENPLAITFDIPPGNHRKIQIRLAGKDFNSSVNLLATLSGMSVSRRGSIYQFIPITDGRRRIHTSLTVPPDLSSRLSEIAGKEATDSSSPEAGSAPQASINEMIAALGLDLDPSTRLSIGTSGELNLETTSTADAAVVSSLIEALGNQPQLLSKFSTKVIELADGMDFTLPEKSQMTGPELQSFMRDMAQKSGVDLKALPSSVLRSGQESSIEMIRELIVPKDHAEGEFETHKIGKVLRLEGNPLGFGQEIKSDFTDTTGEIDSGTGNPVVKKRTELKDSGFSSDQGTRLKIQTRADGSQTIVLITSTLIDATGKPLRGDNEGK